MSAAAQLTATDQSPLSRAALMALSSGFAIGFLPSTSMPVWVGQISSHLNWPGWAGGALASLQLGGMTVGNLLGPKILTAGSPDGPVQALGTWTGLAAGAGLLLMGTPWPFAAVTGALISGCACGMLLALVTSAVARAPDAQRNFAMLQLTLVGAGVALFFLLPRALASYGIGMVFTPLGAAVLVAIPALHAIRDRLRPCLSMPDRPVRSRRAIGVLLALAAMVTSQSAVMTRIMELGGDIGLKMTTIGTILSSASIGCLLWPLAARLIGERWGLLPPLISATLALAMCTACIPRVTSVPAFDGLVVTLMGLPLFIVPYVLALLARFDRGERWAAVAPGFMLAGGAVGPGVASVIGLMGGPLTALGNCGAAAIAGATLVLATYGRPRIASASR
jgi:hypothetical protein